jgi:hypothetical protein
LARLLFFTVQTMPLRNVVVLGAAGAILGTAHEQLSAAPHVCSFC